MSDAETTKQANSQPIGAFGPFFAEDSPPNPPEDGETTQRYHGVPEQAARGAGYGSPRVTASTYDLKALHPYPLPLATRRLWRYSQYSEAKGRIEMAYFRRMRVVKNRELAEAVHAAFAVAMNAAREHYQSKLLQYESRASQATSWLRTVGFQDDHLAMLYGARARVIAAWCAGARPPRGRQWHRIDATHRLYCELATLSALTSIAHRNACGASLPEPLAWLDQPSPALRGLTPRGALLEGRAEEVWRAAAQQYRDTR